MLLKKIKLSGFKSFVDPTTVILKGKMAGVVGPNGCGKSNIIDAVRWVMGESSAKYLRGESSTDVIFNGAATRKPVEQASVELIFDNQDNSLGGEYAQYNEIAIRRTVNRDAVSVYYLNGAKCRKKDIASIFLGTGLGPRSYSIIQQGMVSQLIEAKPEELRVFLEEAAGISKYKARRRETENRIRHTRENLDRLNDIRTELETQLARLERQAEAAERYKVLKEEERHQKGDLNALRWKALEDSLKDTNQIIAEQKNTLEKYRAELREIEANTEKNRETHHDATETFNVVQGEYYTVGNNIARVEQTIAHQKEKHEQLEIDLLQCDESQKDLQYHLTKDEEQITHLGETLVTLTPETESAQAEASEWHARLQSAEEASTTWQSHWDAFNETAAVTSKTVDVEQSRLHQLEDRYTRTQDRMAKQEIELSEIDTKAIETELTILGDQFNSAHQECEATQAKLETLQTRVKEEREAIKAAQQTLENTRRDEQKAVGRLASLEALQQAALGQQEANTKQWLNTQSLQEAKRFAEICKVDAGWERAAETVLGDCLQAVCLPKAIDHYADALQTLDKGQLTLIGNSPNVSGENPGNTLGAKIRSDIAIPVDLSRIYTAETLGEALGLRANLQPHQSVITPEGIWLGRDWIRVSKAVDENAGVIEREQQIDACKGMLESLQATLETHKTALTALEASLQSLEGERDATQKESSEKQSAYSEIKAKSEVLTDRLTQLTIRQSHLQEEQTVLQEELTEIRHDIDQSKVVHRNALTAMEQDKEKREALQAEKEVVMSCLNEVREKAHSVKDHAHQLALQKQSAETQIESLKKSITRATEQLSSQRERKAELQDALENALAPIASLEAELQALLTHRVDKEKALSNAREQVTVLEEEARTLENNRHQADENIQETQQKIQQAELDTQSARVRQQTLVEQLEEHDFVLNEVLAGLDPEATVESIEQAIARTGNKIQRLGAINLAAIEEKKVQAERKEYLDKQNDDLVEALNTLEEAMAKIDKETREKFRETYDFVNATFQVLFPKVFGGGTASLELTGDDLLDTGMVVMARPPGKKNSSIHLLSGGEKALTAIALVFSIFQLNPAPFCMLDEVDAPLDDANVGRFCALVKEMSEKVQFIVISHNKLTMEMNDYLMGVTMHEPGVSRLVSVDMNEAVALVD